MNQQQQQQLSFDFLHRRENNQESQDNLTRQASNLNKQCHQVLSILQTGERLTSWSAMVRYHIGHLPRRILDLKEKGIEIHDQWIENDGSRYKEYFINK